MKKSDVKELIEYIVASGKEIVTKAGKIDDIGVKKQFLTEEDINIERGIKAIIGRMPLPSQFYSEEENDEFIDGESVWIADPISGTKLFIEGKPHYAVVASHLSEGVVDLAIVYDPAAAKLYFADFSEGSSVNNKKMVVNSVSKKKIIYAPSYGWNNLEQVKELKEKLETKFEVYPSQGSFAVNYCMVAEGVFDGVVSLTKDAFPEFAGCFIANKAGAIATNIQGSKDITPEDRVFVCGTQENYNDLFELTKEVIN